MYYLGKILCEPHFDVICDLLLNILSATWNLSVLYNTQKRINDTSTCLSYHIFNSSRTPFCVGLYVTQEM